MQRNTSIELADFVEQARARVRGFNRANRPRFQTYQGKDRIRLSQAVPTVYVNTIFRWHG